MSRNKLYLGVVISSILLVIFYVSYRMLNMEKEEPYYTISVIVENSNSDRWNAFREGLNQGAGGNRIYVNVVSTGDFANIGEQCQIIERELENGADGVIVELCSSEDPDGLFGAAVSDKPVVLVENLIDDYGLYPAVLPDHYSLGAAVARAILDEEGESLEGKTIGILCGNQKKWSLRQRLKGFEETLEESGVEIAWKFQVQGAPELGMAKEYIITHQADIIAALDNDETEKAIDFLLENREISSRLYGEGRSEKVVYHLDKGIIQTLVVPNEYYMGYQSMILMAGRLEPPVANAEQVEADFLCVTKEELYNKDISKILFPTVR